MNITAYHCSPIKIDEFDLTKGCHFGGIFSALEAALRKDGEDFIYLHKVSIEVDTLTESEDLRNTPAWDSLAKDMKKQGIQVARYINKDEPDYKPSYFIVDAKQVKILEIKKMKRDEAEEMICSEFY